MNTSFFYIVHFHKLVFCFTFLIYFTTKICHMSSLKRLYSKAFLNYNHLSSKCACLFKKGG